MSITRRPKLDDVADAAGVSRMTVSRALRQPDQVAPETRARVEAAVKRLGYVPDLAAREMAAGRSGVVGAVLPALDNPFFARTARGLAAGLQPHGMQMLIADSAFSSEGEEQAVAALLARRPAGIVLIGVEHTPVTRRLIADSGVRVVETWDLAPAPIDLCVGFSNRAAVEAVARHFVALGRRRLLGVGTELPRNLARLAGFRAAADGAGVACDLVVVPQPSEGLFQRGRQLFREALERRHRPDALFFISDTYALGALMEAERLGVRVPDDIAIAGFNNHDLAAQWEPGLTTVAVPDRAMGTLAAERLASGAARAPESVDLGFSLIVRRSTAG
jgi:LacI family gluconate utilization system Gnt-I transcriptional repressor